MPESSRPSESATTAATDANVPQADWQTNLNFLAEIAQKLAFPLLTIAATALGIYLSHNARMREQDTNEREKAIAQEMRKTEQAIANENNRQSMRNQREQSETSLRSAMFKELVGPLLNSSGKQKLDPVQAAQQLALLAELLTLNFHEHFELGPMLRYVDTLPGQTADAKARLRSTSRRVISRQLAQISTPLDRDQSLARPSMISIQLIGDLPTNSKGKVNPDAAKRVIEECRVKGNVAELGAKLIDMSCSQPHPTDEEPQRGGVPLRFVSPDDKDVIMVTLSDFNWADTSIRVFAVPTLLFEDVVEAPPADIEFTLTQYSLPFSDNTLLPSGNRFGLYIRKAEGVPDVGALMSVSFVWFPRDFVPPRERPRDMDFASPTLIPTESPNAEYHEDQT